MGRKTRVPTPPRQVKAPRKRVEQGRSSRGPLLVIAVVAGAFVAAAVAFFAPRLSGGGDPTAMLRAAGCSAKTLADKGAAHIADLEQKVKYNSFPPTSGRHFQQPAIFGAYNEPVDQKMVVHNLEHGAVAIQYGDKVPSESVALLNEYWQDDPNGLLLAALPQLDNQIALTAWTQLTLCPSFDEGAFDAFVDAYRFKGPERFPPEALRPGS